MVITQLTITSKRQPKFEGDHTRGLGLQKVAGLKKVRFGSLHR